MCAETLLGAMGACPWPINIVEETGSTNDDLKKQETAPHGTVLIARRQNKGRGRLGRSFLSPEGGLYLSVLLRPKLPPEKLLHLTAMVAVAVRRSVLECCGIETGIKWINDLVYEGKKLCGILTELVTRDGTLDRVVIGIGINCAGVPAQVADIATSVYQISDKNVDVEVLAGRVIVSLWQMAQELTTGKEAYMREYEAACVTVGKQVRLRRAGEERLAFALGIDEDGGLLVRYEDGTLAVVSTGEVSVRGMYGYL